MPETLRDPRGFAAKFDTEDGNWDLVGNNLKVFFIRDAMNFPDLVHTFKPDPATNLQDGERIFSYSDTQRHRVGANYLQLPINAPKKHVATNQWDGHMAYRVDLAPGANPHVNYEPWEKDELILNLVDTIKPAKAHIQQRMVWLFSQCDAGYGKRVAEGLGIAVPTEDPYSVPIPDEATAYSKEGGVQGPGSHDVHPEGHVARPYSPWWRGRPALVNS